MDSIDDQQEEHRALVNLLEELAKHVAPNNNSIRADHLVQEVLRRREKEISLFKAMLCDVASRKELRDSLLRRLEEAREHLERKEELSRRIVGPEGFWEHLRAFARRFTKDEGEVLGLMHDVWIRLCDDPDKTRAALEADSLRAYVKMVLKNWALNQIRGQSRRGKQLLDLSDPEANVVWSPPPADPVGQLDCKQLVREAVEGLYFGVNHELVRAHFLEGLDVEALSSRFSQKPQTIYGILNRARGKLQEHLRQTLKEKDDLGE